MLFMLYLGSVKHVALTTEIRNAYEILVGKLEGKRSLGRHRTT